MTSRDEWKQLGTRVTIQAYDALKDADEPICEIVNQAVKMYLGIEGVSTEEGFENRIEELEEELNRLNEEIEQKQKRRKQVKEKLDGIESQFETFLENRESYRAKLDRILDSMEEDASRNVFGFRSELEEAAKQEHGRATEDNIDAVIEDLKERRDKRNLGIPDTRFRDNLSESPVRAQANGDGPTHDYSDWNIGGVEDDE